MKNKTLWKQVGAAAIAAAMVMSTVPATPVQAAGGKTLCRFFSKAAESGIKNRKREECGHYRKSREKCKDYDSKGNL